MRNRIPVDDFVRESLHGQEEQLNIGAWSNMERMLNGQNPYAKEAIPETKPNNKKWLLGLLLLLITAVGSAIYKTVLSPKQANVLATNNTNNLPNITPSAANVIDAQSYNAHNTVTGGNANTLNQENSTEQLAENNTVAVSTNKTLDANLGDTPLNENNSASDNNSTSKVVNIIAEPTKQNGPTIVNSSKKFATRYKTPKSNLSTNIADESTSNIAIATDNSNVLKRIEVSKNSGNKSLSKGSKKHNLVRNNDIENNRDVDPTKVGEINAIENTTVSSKVSELASNTKPTSKKPSAKKVKQINDSLVASITDNKSATINNKVNSKLKADSITKVWVSKKVVKGAKGTKQIILDTTNIVKIEKPIDTTTQINSEIASKKVAENNTANQMIVAKASIEPQKSNPRYMPNAKKQNNTSKLANTNKPSVEKVVANKPTNANSSTSNNNLAVKAIEKNIDRETKKTKPAKQDIMGTAMANAWRNAIEQIKKVGYLKIFHEKIPINPGIFVGINASAFNSQKHDFGGYQIGGNILMKIAKNLNLVPHLSFFARNNSGYSIRDNSINVAAQSVPYNYSGNNYAVQFQYDSTVYVHNFKHLYNIEAPIALQYNRKNFAVYGGVNIAYMFKMKTNNITRGYGYGNSNQNIVLDTMFNVTGNPVYPFPSSRSSFYKSPDFNSRLGFGYIAGLNYHFTPNFYIDARVTQNLWDNSTTPSSLEMSKKMFRLRSYQISLGYRFKENSN